MTPASCSDSRSRRTGVAGSRSKTATVPAEVPARAFLHNGWLPFGCARPRVIILPAINARKGDRAGRNVPLIVGADDLNRAIGVFEADLCDGLERAERTLEFGVATAVNVVHPVAEQKPGGIRALAE